MILRLDQALDRGQQQRGRLICFHTFDIRREEHHLLGCECGRHYDGMMSLKREEMIDRRGKGGRIEGEAREEGRLSNSITQGAMGVR